MEKGYEARESQNEDIVIASWWQAWEIFKTIIGQEKENISVHCLMEEQDYHYSIDVWLQDFEMELGNAGRT